MPTPPTQSPPAADETVTSPDATQPRRRVFTVRAVVIGLVLVVGLGLLVPYSDLALGNTLLFNNYLPPVITLVLLALGLAVNPLLGRHRLSRGEVVVVTVMLLGLGGVASSGLMRYLPTMIAGTSQHLATRASLAELRQELSEEERAALRAQVEERIAGQLAALDADGDGGLGPAEFAGDAALFAQVDADGDGRIGVSELTAHRIAVEPDLVPEYRWPFRNDLYLGIPEVGPVPTDDPEYEHVVGGYLQGFPPPDQLRRVGHRRRVTWSVEPGGELHRDQLALAGRVAREHRAQGAAFLDLEDPRTGKLLNGLPPGGYATREADRTHTVEADAPLAEVARAIYGDPELAEALARANDLEPGATVAAGRTLRVPDVLLVRAVEPPGVPWYAWIAPTLNWLPLLFGALVAMVAVAALVRRQWIEHERLPYPIAEVTLSLMDEPERGRRFGKLFTKRSFWVGCAVAGFITLWRGLHVYELVPVDIAMTLNLGTVFQGHPWNLAPDGWGFYNLRIFFSIVALTFFLSLDLSFSLWFFFVATNILVILAVVAGFDITAKDTRQASLGGFGVLCLLILWVGRQYYWRVLRAAFAGLRGDEAARQAAPYVWALLIGCGLMVSFMVVSGAPFGPALLVVLMFLGVLLVLSRIVAESGVPFVQMPTDAFLNSTLFTLIGFSHPAAALLPLTLVGLTVLADPREALMPYAVNAEYLGHKTRAPRRPISSFILIGACVGGVFAFIGLLLGYYFGDGGGSDAWPGILLRKDGLEIVARGLKETSTPEGAVQNLAMRQESWANYGAGGIIVAVLGAARHFFSGWPLHPIGYVVSQSYPTRMVWFSFFLGWLIKALVMRYGGTALYARLKPVAIGLIAGEAAAAGVFIVVTIVAKSQGHDIDVFRALPG